MSTARNTVGQLRDHLDMTLAEFGESISLSPSRIFQMEQTGASAKAALAMKDAFRDEMHRLGLTVEDLIRGTRAA